MPGEPASTSIFATETADDMVIGMLSPMPPWSPNEAPFTFAENSIFTPTCFVYKEIKEK